MVDIYRGELLTVRAAPKDIDGNPVTPTTVNLYLRYTHADGTVQTDEPLEMELDESSGKYEAEFDTAVMLPGILQGSIRAIDPPGAVDFKKKIIANGANPAPEDST